ncbi:MAG: TIGR04255 family protein [Emcibacter sp.]|nr:TIGR04255 family protein [Emcibacter sp.]
MKIERPHFKKPPIIEVVCSVAFAPIEKFQSVHFGEFWSKIKSEFPETQDVPPINRVPEIQENRVTFEFGTSLPLPRVWFVGNDQHELIQLQKDRFLFNWRKLDDGEYPRFEEVFDAFKQYWNEFISFIDENQLGSIHIKQLELSYINEDYEQDSSKTTADLASILKSPVMALKQHSFLPELNALNWKTAYLLPNNCGQLTVHVTNGIPKPQKPLILRMDFVVAGMPSKDMNEPLDNWFKLARDWVVNSFLELTCEDIQKTKWERIK